MNENQRAELRDQLRMLLIAAILGLTVGPWIIPLERLVCRVLLYFWN